MLGNRLSSASSAEPKLEKFEVQYCRLDDEYLGNLSFKDCKDCRNQLLINLLGKLFGNLRSCIDFDFKEFSEFEVVKLTRENFLEQHG